MTSHQNFIQFEAQDEKESGFFLGQLFQEVLKEDLDFYKSTMDWPSRVNASRPFLDLTQKHFPFIYNELVGHSTGSKIDLYDLWTMMIENEWDHQCHEKCTTIVSNDGMVVGHNEDWDIESKDYITVVKKKVSGITTFELYYIGSLGGNTISINSHGVIHSINSLNHKGAQVGIPKDIIAKSFSETKVPLDSIDQFQKIKRSSGYHHLIISPSKGCYSVESTSTRYRYYKPEFPFAHTNHYLTDLKKYEDTENQCGTFRRYARANDLLKTASNTSDIKNILNDRNGGKIESIFNERTIAKMVVDLKQLKIDVWLLRENKKKWVSYSLDFLNY